MNRIDRLCAIIIQLQSKKVVRAKEIAARFEISLRTVYRDIRALEDGGIPIGSEAGIGYFLVAGYHLPPVMFTRAEAGALVLGGKLIEKFSDASVNRHFAIALDKIKAVMAGADKTFLNTLDSRIEVLDTNTLKTDSSSNNLLPDIQAVVGQNHLIRIEYHSGYKNEATLRTVEPVGICFYAAHWHLIAFCRLRNDYRDFRIDRIKAFYRKPELFQRSQHPSLQHLIRKLVVATDLKPATIKCDRQTALNMADRKYYYGFAGQKAVYGGVQMQFLSPSYTYLAGWLLTLLDRVEVISPPELQTLLKSYVRKLYDHHLKPISESESD